MRAPRLLVLVLLLCGLAGCGDERPAGAMPTPTPTMAPPATPSVTAGIFALSTVESTLLEIPGTDLTAFEAPAPLVRLIASSGTPFAGGTAAVVDLPGTIASATRLTAMSPLAAASADFSAGILVVHPSGNQSGGTATFRVPTITGFTPPTLERGVAATLDVAGAGFASSTGVVDVVLTAQGGATPFAGGTSDQHVVAGATVASATQITAGVTIPDIVGVANATITVQFPGGTSIEAPGTIAVEGRIVVTNLNDSGAGSLREALSLAGSGGSVEFDPALTGTIALATPLDIAGDVRIDGPGAATIQVSGQGAVRVLQVASGATVEIVGLAIEDGLAASGAAVLATTADLTFRMCEFSGNEGGDIVDVPAGMTHGDVAARGGVLAMDAGSLTLDTCAFDNNVLAVDLAVRAGATAGNVAVLGGILACGNADVSLTNCSSSSDEARMTILAESGATVGNVTTKGGFVYTGSGALTLTNLQSDLFSHSMDITLDPAATIGDVTTWGGLACSESGAVVVDQGTTFTIPLCLQTFAMDLDGTVGNLALRGGLLHAGSGALTIRDVTVIGYRVDLGLASPLLPGVTRQTVGDVTVLGATFFAGSGAVLFADNDTDTDLDVDIYLGEGSSLGDVRCEGGTLHAGTGALAVTGCDFDDSNVENINVTATASSIGGVGVAGAAVWTAAATPTFEDCFFNNCDFDVNLDLTTCFADDVAGRGVAICCDSTVVDLTVTNCRFQDQDLEIAVFLDSGSLVGSVLGEGGDVSAGPANVVMTDCLSDDVEIDLDVTLQGASLLQAVRSFGGCLRADGGAVRMTDCAITDPLITPTVFALDGSVVEEVAAYGGGLAHLAAVGGAPQPLDLTSTVFGGLDGEATVMVGTGAVVTRVVLFGGQVISSGDVATIQDCVFADNTLALDCDLNAASEIATVLVSAADLLLAPLSNSTVEATSFDRARLEVDVRALSDARIGDVLVWGGSCYSLTGSMSATTFRDCKGSGAALDVALVYGSDARLDGVASVMGGALYASSDAGGGTLLQSCAFTDVTFDYVFEADGNGPVDYDTVGGGGCLAHAGAGSLSAFYCILDVGRFSVDGTLTEVAPGLGVGGDWRIGGGVLFNESGRLNAVSCVLAIDDWELAWTFDVQTLGNVVTGTVCGTIGYERGGTLFVSGSSQIVGTVTAGPPVVVGPGSMSTTPTLDPSTLCP